MSGVTTATVIAGAGAAASLASTGMSIMGGMNSAAGTSAANRTNMILAQQAAQQARDEAAADAEDIALSTRRTLGSIRANAGAGGVIVDDGSPLETVIASAGAGELNRLRRLWQGEVGARNAMLGGFASQRQDSSTSYYGQAGSSLLTGASKVRDLLDSFKKTG
jgi:hypothetical protein